MASLLLQIFLISATAALLASPSQAATCKSQKFKNNKVYSSCTDLSTLSSYLHWTYDPANSSLAVAFVATSKSTGWVSWAVNPTGTKMLGSQALVAYNLDDGTPTVKTYSITSYEVQEGKLSFEVWDTSAEFSDGMFKIFATVKVPAKADTVNQVWQVGPGINKTTGFIMKHEFRSANLDAYGPLSLAGVTNASNGTNGTNTTASDTATNSTSSDKSGAYFRHGGHVGLFSILLLVLATLTFF